MSYSKREYKINQRWI